MRPLPVVSCHTRGVVSGKTTLLSLLPVSVWPFQNLLWSSCLADSQILFKGNCSVYSCRFVGSTKGDKFRIFLCCHLEPLSYPEHFDLCKAGTPRMKPNKNETECHVCLTQPFKNCLSSMVCEVPANSSSLEEILRAGTQIQSLRVDSSYDTDQDNGISLSQVLGIVIIRDNWVHVKATAT